MTEAQDTIQVITTLDQGCVVGIGCKVHTHHKIVEKKLQPMERFTIFGKSYCTNQWGQTFEIVTEDSVQETQPILMEKVYASDTIKPTNSRYLLAHKPEAKIIIKPRIDFKENQRTIDAPVMGMLLTFTIYLTTQWAWSSLPHWNKLYSELTQCLRSSS